MWRLCISFGQYIYTSKQAQQTDVSKGSKSVHKFEEKLLLLHCLAAMGMLHGSLPWNYMLDQAFREGFVLAFHASIQEF